MIQRVGIELPSIPEHTHNQNRMVAYNRSSHEGSVTYYSTVGKQYRGTVTVYAKDVNGLNTPILTIQVKGDHDQMGKQAFGHAAPHHWHLLHLCPWR